MGLVQAARRSLLGRIVTLELGEAVDRGDADPGFGALAASIKAARKVSSPLHRISSNISRRAATDFSRFQAAARALATSGLSLAVLTSACAGVEPAQHARGMLELEQVFVVRLLEVELLDQPALGVDLDHLGPGRGRDHKLVRGPVDHDRDDARLPRVLGDFERRRQAEQRRLRRRLSGSAGLRTRTVLSASSIMPANLELGMAGLVDPLVEKPLQVLAGRRFHRLAEIVGLDDLELVRGHIAADALPPGLVAQQRLAARATRTPPWNTSRRQTCHRTDR